MAFKMAGWSGYQKDPSAFPKDTPEQIKATTEKAKNVSYSDAYKNRGDQYKNYTESEFKAESKRQMDIYKKTGKWDYKNAPKKDAPKPKPSTTTKTNKVTGKTTEKYTSADGNFTSKTKTNKDGDMTKMKTENKDFKGDGSMVNVKTKDKYDNEGNIKKEKTITNDPNKDIIETKKVKYDTKAGKERKNITRTRKKGGTGIASAIKQKAATIKQNRANKKKNKK